MKLPKSSSMILATLAVSSSTPSLAAPTGDASTSDVSSHIASRRSSVSHPTQDAERRDLGLCPLVNGLTKPLEGLLPLQAIDAIGNVLGQLVCPPSGTSAAYETPNAQQLAQINALEQTLSVMSALAQQNSVSSSDSLSPSPTTVPPNSPNPSDPAQPTDSSTVQQRDALFARRGVAAAPPQPPAPSLPANVQSQPPTALPTPANVHPPSAPAAVPHPSAPTTVPQPPAPVRRAWSSRALSQAQAPAAPPVPAAPQPPQVPSGLPQPQVPAGGPQQVAAAAPGAPRPSTPTGAPAAPQVPAPPAPASVPREVDENEDCDE